MKCRTDSNFTFYSPFDLGYASYGLASPYAHAVAPALAPAYAHGVAPAYAHAAYARPALLARPAVAAVPAGLLGI